MRIVSLAPEATEILASLGHGSEITALPAESVATPEQLAVALQITQPTLIFTSESVAGGGVPRVDVRRAISRLRPRPGVYALEPHTLGDILSDIKTVGDATGHQHAARTLIEALRARIDAVSLRSARVLETTLASACSLPRQSGAAHRRWLVARRAGGPGRRAGCPRRTGPTAPDRDLGRHRGRPAGAGASGRKTLPCRAVRWVSPSARRPSACSNDCPT